MVNGFTFLSQININQKEVGNYRLLQLICHKYVDCFYQRISYHHVRLGFEGYPMHVPYFPVQHFLGLPTRRSVALLCLTRTSLGVGGVVFHGAARDQVASVFSCKNFGEWFDFSIWTYAC